mmetsp:Transcript_11165/g.27012  ORF Transcript_11165/g.27012 Transcript_11165/m.27012 type:complete len:304 (+) Transcript_11165:197-1108(+)
MLAASFNKPVRQHQRTHLASAVVKKPIQSHKVQNMVAKPAHRPLLNRHHRSVCPGQPPDEVDVQRPHKSRIRHGHTEVGVLALESMGGLDGRAEPRADREDGNLAGSVFVGLFDDASLADGHCSALGGHLVQPIVEVFVEVLQAISVAARIPHGRRLVIDLICSLDVVHEFDLIAGGHDNQVGQSAQVGQVEGAVVRRTVGAHQPGTIQNKPDGQPLEDAVVYDLVVCPLQEGRVDGAEGLDALTRQPSRKSHRMLLGDADIEGPLGELLGELRNTRPARHRSRYRNHFGVLCSESNQGVCKN